MSFKVITTPRFEKSAKALAKRYRSLKTDLGHLFASLETDPAQGDELTPGLRKLRMAITSKGRGKSVGARVITYTILTAESNGRVYLIDIYDKSDYSTVDVVILHQIISSLDMTSDS